MTKASLVAYLIMGAAIAGLFVWNLDLSQELQKPSSASSGGNGTRSDRSAVGDVTRLEERLDGFDGRLQQTQTTVRELEGRVGRVEARRPVAPAADGAEPVAAPSYAETELEQQIEAYLTRREEEQRKAERARQMARVASMYLRELNATPVQEKEFVEILTAFYDDRREIMEDTQRYPTQEARQAAAEQLTAERDVRLQQVFDASQFSQLTERLNRLSRGPRGFPGRGGGR